MKYLLDTNAWIEFLRRPLGSVATRLGAEPVGEVVLCSVARAELLYGIESSSNLRRQLPQLRMLFATFPSLPFDDVAAEEYGRIRVELARLGTQIGPYDLQLAAIALANDLTLVTHNIKEFSRVPGLNFDDWQ